MTENTTRKTKFYWASIAGAEPEPVEVTRLNGKRVAYTCGCGDPFYLDKANCPVRLCSAVWGSAFVGYFADFHKPVEPMERPVLNEDENQNAAENHARQEFDRTHVRHSWRGPR